MYDVITEIPHKSTLQSSEAAWRLGKYTALRCLHLRVDALEQPRFDAVLPSTLANLRGLHILWDGCDMI